MSWKYIQSTGQMFNPDGLIMSTGYSGAGAGKNNPAMQNVQDVGPCPVGFYDMGTAVDTETHGPCVIPLTPRPENEMYGRSGFLCHGDSVNAPGTASKGCIIQAAFVRHAMRDSQDRSLQVVSEPT